MRDHGEEDSLVKSMDAISYCLRQPQGCNVVPGTSEVGAPHHPLQGGNFAGLRLGPMTPAAPPPPPSPVATTL